MKTLEKDRIRRYETANDLAADLKRHLDNEPVIACHRGGKGKRRHPQKRHAPSERCPDQRADGHSERDGEAGSPRDNGQGKPTFSMRRQIASKRGGARRVEPRSHRKQKAGTS